MNGRSVQSWGKGGRLGMRKVIAPEQVSMGMIVHGFKGSWFDHPFWRTGFRVVDELTLRKLRASTVDGVIVECQSDTSPTQPPIKRQPEGALKTPLVRRDATAIPMPFLDENTRRKAELERARAVIHRAKGVVMKVFADARLGCTVRPSAVAITVGEIIEGVYRNPSAMIQVARLKNKTEYTYMHSVAVCALMVNLARTPEFTGRGPRGHWLCRPCS